MSDCTRLVVHVHNGIQSQFAPKSNRVCGESDFGVGENETRECDPRKCAALSGGESVGQNWVSEEVQCPPWCF